MFQNAAGSVREFLVFRVDTRASTYHVAIGIVGGRLLACLRGDSPGKLIREADGAPLVGDASLFETAPGDWIGKALRLGAVVTSPVYSVVAENDDLTVREVIATFVERELTPSDAPARGSAPPPTHRPPTSALRSGSATVAQRVVQHAEVAAWCLRRLNETEDGMQAVLAEPEARARMHDALADCAILLRQLTRRA